MPRPRNSSSPGRRTRCASRDAAMPAASRAPATRISSPSVTLRRGYAARVAHGVVWRHARGGHDPRADRGGRSAGGAARPTRGRREAARGRDHQPQLPGQLRRRRVRRAAARQGHQPARHRPRGRAPGHQAGRRARHRAEGGRDVRGPAVPRHLLRRGTRADVGGAARAGRARRGRQAGCGPSTTPASSCRPSSRCTTSSASTPTSRAPGAARCRRPSTARSSAPARS